MRLIRWDPFELTASYDVRRNTIIHIGAHEGEELNQYKLLGYPETLWVEPQPEAFSNLCAIAGESRCLNAAVWKVSGVTLEFNQTNNSVSSGLFKLTKGNPWENEIHVRKTFQVNTLTLPDVIRIFEDREVLKDRFVLRLDVQGAEYNILRNCGKLLQRIDFICCEVTRSKKIYEGAETRRKIVGLLLRQGWIPLFSRINPVNSHGETIFISVFRLGIFWRAFFYMRFVSFLDHTKYYFRKLLKNRSLNH